MSATPPPADHQVVLLRHGETHGYHDDVGLTELGERQAHDAGVALATRLGSGTWVDLRHAPTARATATARALRAALTAELAPGSGVEVGEPVADPAFDSLRFFHDGDARESSVVAAARLARGTPHEDRVPDWVAEYDRFDTDFGTDSKLGGPIDRWMVATTRHFEPPQVIVYRAWAGVRALVRDATPGSITVVCSHSALLRALVASAIGADPGEPANLEEVSITVGGDVGDGCARVRFRDHDVVVEVPAAAPPWLASAYLES